MNIIPTHPYNTNSNAEYRLFKKLEEAFYGDHSYVAFHSLNLTHHKNKRFGEADFVILCKYGLFVFEVKGGGISYRDGTWFTVDKKRQEFRIQDPFRQAEDALHALKNKIEDNFRSFCTLPIGYGVVFPDITWCVTGSEWAPQIICDKSKFRNIESWLKSFFHYWQQKPHNQKQLSTEQIKPLKFFIRPNFELIEPLHHRIHQLNDQVVKLTEEQYSCLDIVAANKRVLCSGGAGTGKTFLAAELCRRLATKDRKVVLACKSSWLRFFLQNKIVNEHVIISTIESLIVDQKRAGITQYDVLIVDEGQDLFDFDAIERLDTILKGGLETGEWYIFHDINNQSGLFVETKPEILELLKSYSPTIIPLKTNCRNTLAIIKTIKAQLSLDMGSEGVGDGPQVKTYCEKETSNYLLTLEEKLHELLEDGVPASSITILSPFSFNESSITKLPAKLKNKIVDLDDYSIRNFPISNISFSEIKNFKGLENEVIFVVDLQEPIYSLEMPNKVLHYVSMTRARSLLLCFWINQK